MTNGLFVMQVRLCHDDLQRSLVATFIMARALLQASKGCYWVFA